MHRGKVLPWWPDPETWPTSSRGAGVRDNLKESETWLAVRVLAAALGEHTVTWCCAQVRGTGGGLWCLGFVTNDTELSRSMAVTMITSNMEHQRHTHYIDYLQQCTHPTHDKVGTRLKLASAFIHKKCSKKLICMGCITLTWWAPYFLIVVLDLLFFWATNHEAYPDAVQQSQASHITPLYWKLMLYWNYLRQRNINYSPFYLDNWCGKK